MCGSGERAQQSNIPAPPDGKASAAPTFWATREPRLAPHRETSEAKWFVDGKDTFESVADDLRTAEKTIDITGWMVTTDLELVRRPLPRTRSWQKLISESAVAKADKENLKKVTRYVVTEWQLFLQRFKNASDDSLIGLLFTAAIQRGVQVRVLIWNDPTGVLGFMGTGDEAALAELQRAGRVLRQVAPGTKGKIEAHLCTPNVSGPDMSNSSWSFHQKTIVIDRKKAFLGGIDLARGRWDTPSHELDGGLSDFQNDYYNATLPPKESDPKKNPRLPWHDVHVRVLGVAAGDVARNFEHRWAKQTGTSLVDDTTPAAATAHTGKQQVQIVRSIAASTGAPTGSIETSICEVYEKGIENAQHLIYIENQFFISKNAWCPYVQNTLAKKLIERVWKAMDEDITYMETNKGKDVKPTFCAVVVLPVTPDAEDSGWWPQARRGQLYEEYGTVEHILGVLRARLSRRLPRGPELRPSGDNTPDLVDRYIGFYSLYRHGQVNGQRRHGQIYVHVKTMIVDDRVAIIGSANLFDRSLLGDRDAEIAAVVIDDVPATGKKAGQTITVRKFACSLRKALWAEHLGVSSSTVDDPIATYQNLWLPRARANTTAYEAALDDMPRRNGVMRDDRPVREWLPRREGVLPAGFRLVLAQDKDDQDALHGTPAPREGNTVFVPTELDQTSPLRRSGPADLSRLAGVKGHLIDFPVWAIRCSRPTGEAERLLAQNQKEAPPADTATV